MAFNNFPTTDLQNLNLDWLLRRLVDLERIVEELAEHGTGGDVQSVNGKTGVVVLTASDVGAYVKPSGGIPKTDLANAVQTSLGKADTAYQKPSSGIPTTDLAAAVLNLLLPVYGSEDAGRFLRVGSGGVVDWEVLQIEPNRVSVTGTTPEIAAQNNTIYECGECTTLDITSYPATGIFSIIFHSGTTATVLTPASGIVMPDDFTVEANKRYEINVLDGYALVAGWDDVI